MIDEVFLLDQWNCRADDEPYANAATKEDSIVDFNEYSAELLVATRRDSDDTLNALEASRERLLAAARGGRLGKVALARTTAARMIAAWTLMPAPHNPVAHVEAAHAKARIHLARLTEHPPAVEVTSVMTADIFAQLTKSRPPAAAGRRYTYTPRKVLRRVLDHGLDHLNQIDQWLTWQRHGVAPTPTDGWASSLVTLPGDCLPLTADDLAAWLWRIDQVVLLLVHRAAGLSETELDWIPPDGGWPLRRVLHHVARSEILYSASLDEALPEEPLARYVEAGRRFGERLTAAYTAGADPSILYITLYGVVSTPAGVAREVLSAETQLEEST